MFLFGFVLELCYCLYLTEYLNIGDMNTMCHKCFAMVWYAERARKDVVTNTPKISLCCMQGNITIPFMTEPPPLIRNLFNGTDARGSHFLANVRSYNNMFAFTSLGGRVDTGRHDGRGPPQFIIAGQNYHRIGSLAPNKGQAPKFAQLYIYGTENEVSNRLSHFRCLFYMCI